MRDDKKYVSSMEERCGILVYFLAWLFILSIFGLFKKRIGFVPFNRIAEL